MLMLALVTTAFAQQKGTVLIKGGTVLTVNKGT